MAQPMINGNLMKNRPNILLAIADDLAWPHISAYGCKFVSTPNIDRVAKEGILFGNCYTAAPTCTASRAALLTGKYPWQLEEGCQLWGLLPSKYKVYPDILEEAGYWVGLTNKGWGPGSLEASGRTRNPAGPSFDRFKCEPLTNKMNRNDYPANFEDFMNQKPDDQPFCFWFGAKEPHRDYETGSGLKYGSHKLEDVEVPDYLPDCPEVRSDFLDYALEVERYDRDLGQMIELLEARGELENTIILVTGDNGNPFPRAKATVYQNGCHVPLAIRWGKACPGNRKVSDFISFVDFAPTLLEVAGIDLKEYNFSGKSFMDVITANTEGRVNASRNMVITGRERHAYSRHHNLGYPSRSIVTDDYLYIRNFEPERMPGGDPSNYGDVDASPSKTCVLESRNTPKMEKYYELCFGKRPAEELYAAADGPDCVKNVADDAETRDVINDLRTKLEEVLTTQGDPRMHNRGWIFDCFPYYGNDGFADEKFPPVAWSKYQLRHLPKGMEPPEFNAEKPFMTWGD
jgi:N-sulfoglucosamine sulfohydrolase